MSTQKKKKGAVVGQNESESANMSPGLTKGRLLVIDDDAGMQSLLADVLTSMGYSVTSFSDAIGALKLIAASEQKIDAVICDLNMPRVNGLAFMDMLAKMNVKTPVILITAFATSKTAHDAQNRGAFAYLSKPFQLSEIKELIEKAVA